MESLISAVLFLIVFGSILFLAYVTTKFIGTGTNKMMKGRYINIIETVNLGFDSKLHLVKVGPDFVLISTSGKNTCFLTKVELEEYSDNEEKASNNSFNFKNVFDKYFQGFKDKQENKNFTSVLNKENREILNERVFNKNLKRLKDISTGISLHKTEDGEEYTNEKRA